MFSFDIVKEFVTSSGVMHHGLNANHNHMLFKDDLRGDYVFFLINLELLGAFHLN
jgi:hypothetical protein